MNSKEAVETARCMKESLDTGKIIEPQEQSILMENKVLEKIEKVGDTYIFETYEKPLRQQIEDLKQENKELKKQVEDKNNEIENLKENDRITHALYKNIYTQLQNYKNQLYDIDLSKIRKKKLTFEEKEIYYKGFENCERQIASNIADITIKVRKKVCDETREFVDNNEHSEENEAKQSSESVVYTRQLYKFLDQIEQGEEEEDE